MAGRVTTKPHAAVRMPRAERREQIVRAAAAAFLAAGYDKTSMEDVARAAGVTRLIVYRIFESKEAVYLAVLNAVLDEIAHRFDFGHDVESVRRESVTATLLAAARSQPDGFRLLWRHTSNQPEFSAVFVEFKAAVTSYTEALIEPVIHDRTLRQWAAQSLVSHAYESICLWLDAGDADRDDELLRLLAESVRATVVAWAADAN